MAELLDANLVRVSSVADGDQTHFDPGAIAVQWTPPPDAEDDRLFQIYVNGELAAVTCDPDQRELIVPAGTHPDWPVVAVQVMAAAPGEAETDFRHLLEVQQRGRRALLRWPRLNSAELGSTVNVFGNGGAGEIDFDSSLNDQPIPMFPDGSGKWGFGLGGFGADDFGYGGGRSLGLGLGAFGVGEFGFDSEWAEWLSEPLPAGVHRLAALACDRLGNPSGQSPPEVELAMAAAPPARIDAPSVDGDAADDSLVLTWQLES